MALKSARRNSRSCMVLALAGALSGLRAEAPVVISEIHYDPAEGASLEFVELHNPGDASVALSGWSFSEGIRFTFPDSTFIVARGYVVVCQDRDALARAFTIPVESLHGNFAGSLDNGGEQLALADQDGLVVDALRYDDDPPWDPDAAGTGPSLQRLCPSFASDLPSNWSAREGARPTPLGPNPDAACPPPGSPPPAISINEIYYHPLGDKDADEEFVELRNNTGQAVNLKGYSFSLGIDFTFQEDLVLAPGALAVVCRNKSILGQKYNVENIAGDYSGQLSNDGERITLVDPSGAFVDSVRYRDGGDWPVAADGLGYSLEKIVPTAPSDDPASWKEAGLGDVTQWRHVDLSGKATSSKLLLYLDAEGEFLLDNVKLVDPAAPDVNFAPNGSFDTGIESWLPKGNHADSLWDPQGGADSRGALKLVSRGRGTGSTNGISVDTVPELVRTNGPTYRLSFDFKYVTGSRGLTFKLNQSTTLRGIYWQLGAGVIASPGAPNPVASDHLPPFVSTVERFPPEPGSTDATWIRARVRTDRPPAAVKLSYWIDSAKEATEIDMLDDGLHGDASAGDGIHGASIPPQPHNTVLTFKIRAEDSTGTVMLSPPDTDPTGTHGFYVNDLKPESPLPVYTLLLDHTSKTPPRSILAALNCSTYRQGAFAYKGDLYYKAGIRQRGQSVCGSTKPFLKVHFQRGRDFQKQRKLNLQSLWTDKSLVREILAWETFRDVGMPYCAEEHVRLHVNGKYFGLYGALEHPDARFLERNRLDAAGNLYKAVASTEDPKANYVGAYEKKTNENNDFSDLTEFLNTMHKTPRNQLVAFFSQRMDEDRVIDYQMAQTLTNNSDYPHKNHYLYHDAERDKWMPLTWDMDLTFGKLWDGNFGGVLHDKMHTPGNNPWYTTSVDGGLGNHLLDKFFSQGGTWYRRAYIVRLWDALQEKYTEDFFRDRIGELHDLILDEQAEDIAVWNRSAATADDPKAPKEFEPNLERVQQHVRLRRAYLLNYLSTRHKFSGHDRLKITECMYNPPGGGEELEYLELWNSTGKEIDISGWSIEGIDYVFPAGTSMAKDAVAIVAKDPTAFRAKYRGVDLVFGPYAGSLDNDGEILRVKDAGPDYPATVDFLRYGAEGDWPREADGAGRSLELARVSVNRDNDPARNWRSSLAPGGSPGSIEGITPDSPVFRRGDPSGDGKINILDALVILRREMAPEGLSTCGQSADVNGDGKIEITDAILLLQYLFGSNSAAIPPPGPNECSPTRPDLCAKSNCTQ